MDIVFYSSNHCCKQPMEEFLFHAHNSTIKNKKLISMPTFFNTTIKTCNKTDCFMVLMSDFNSVIAKYVKKYSNDKNCKRLVAFYSKPIFKKLNDCTTICQCTFGFALEFKDKLMFAELPKNARNINVLKFVKYKEL